MDYIAARSLKVKVRKIKKDNICKGLGPFTTFLQCVGILPLYNIKDVDKMKFVLKSWRTLFSFVWILAFVVTTLIFIAVGFQVSYNLQFLVVEFFYIQGLVSVILYFRLSQSWPKLMRKWCSVDKAMDVAYGYPNNLDKYIKRITVIYGIIGLVEHSLSLARNVIATFDLHGNHSTFEDYYAQSFPRLFQIMPFSSSFGFFITVSKGELLCVVAFLLDSVWTGNIEHLLSVGHNCVSSFQIYGEYFTFKDYFDQMFPNFFNVFQYHNMFGAYIYIVNLYGTITWAVNDIFLMLISTSLALRFRQVADRMKYKDKSTFNSFWKEVREDYDRLCELCREVDRHLSYIILLSFSVNLFFILIQLYHSIENIPHPVEKIYFIYSFSYTILKLVSVSLFGAWINDESKSPLDVLVSVSSEVYNIEIERLINQISADNVALTGNKMFKITRSLILQMAGAIVTYELVLIQFDNASEEIENHN